MFAVIVANALELLAFIASFIYYKKNKSKPTFYLTLFLFITICVEILGWYSVFTVDYGYLSFLKGGIFEKNYWLYNLYGIVSFLFYINYFKWYLTSKKSVVFLNILSLIFIAVCVFEIIFTNEFFDIFLPVFRLFGTLLVFISIALYYLELLKSDQILSVQRSLPFYISVGALFFHLCTTPLFIYSSYFSNSIDPGFVKLYKPIIFGCNYFLYATYIVGFLICYQKENPYFPKKNY